MGKRKRLSIDICPNSINNMASLPFLRGPIIKCCLGGIVSLPCCSWQTAGRELSSEACRKTEESL